VALNGNLTGSSQFFSDELFYNGVATTSLRLDSVSGKALNRTMTTGNRRLFTYSFWFKTTKLGSRFLLSKGENVSNADISKIQINSSDQLVLQEIVDDSASFNLVTTRVFRDTSAWYNVVIAFDTAQGTDTNRVKVYVNGVQETSFGTATYPGQNYDALYTFNQSNSSVLQIGRYSADTSDTNEGWDGYLSDITHIDGAALSASSFGETKNGVWIPINTSGLTFGDEGFLLKFNQVGVGTASTSTIGADTSGNNNHFTSTNIVASDCAMPDSPENNFCTLNSLINSTGTIAQSEGNLRSTQSGTTSSYTLGTIPFRSGKWWMEVRLNAFNDNYAPLVIRTDISQNSDGSNNNILNAAAGAVGMYQNGEGFVDGSSIGHGTFAPSGHDGNDVGDVIGVAVDLDSGTPTIKFFLDGTQTSITQNLPASMLNTDLAFGCLQYNGNTLHFNWGQDSTFGGNETAQGNTDANGIGDFFYAPPSGYLALCSANLPEPTIGPNSGTNEQSDDYFNTVLWTGTGSSRSIDVGFQPDWAWIKARNAGAGHTIFDSSRGDDIRLNSSDTNVDQTISNALAFSSTGYTVNNNATNEEDRTFVSWNWKANSGTATATISESGNNPAAVVQANPKAGFSIITYTGTGDTGTIAHGLGAVPTWILIKNRDQADSWAVYHGGNTSAPATDYLKLDTNATTSDGVGWWDDTAPTSSVFTVHDQHMVNADGEKYVAYVFADVEGYSKMGSYISNQSTDGTFIYLGFRPKFVIVKRTNATYSWMMYDDKRDPFNVMNTTFFADLDNAESASDNIDFVSNGIKLRTTGNSFNGGSGSLFIYMAFAEAPFKYANAR